MLIVMPDESNADAIRASHADREQVQALLREAMNEGRITPDEFAERTAAAAEARTIGELRPLLQHLPVEYVGPSAAPSVAGGEVVEWRGVLGSTKKKGVWTVPPRIRIHRRMGSVELDFTEAQFTSPVTDIELDVIGASIEIRVPESATVSTDEVGMSMGSVEDHRKSRTAGGSPRLRFHGSLKMGSFEIRGPRKRMFS
jgi:hypothetical protein